MDFLVRVYQKDVKFVLYITNKALICSENPLKGVSFNPIIFQLIQFEREQY